ncbi:hypothetical protein, partial [Vibrio parahaemolyticus]|uniref:hypothetical protein n=1 Tax=Vibrio parahaemolyticus TaxID=670 RepID=UPI00255462CA
YWMGINGKIFGVYRVLFLVLHLVKCAFHVLSGGTICGVFALTSPFTVSNFRAISLVLRNFRQKTSFFVAAV